MANCSIYCEPYSRKSRNDGWTFLYHGELQQSFNPEKDQIKVLSGKLLLSGIQLQYAVQCDEFVVNTKDFEIELEDEIIPVKWNFRRLADLIEHSKYMLLLGPGWDEENALAIDPEIWKVAVKFLIQCATDIFENHDRIIEEPEINPCKDGTIDLSWRTSRVRLLINFRHSAEGVRAYYYGDFYQSKQPIKGWINADSTDNFLSLWMKNLAM